MTSGFLHVSLVHIGFNMLLLYFLGRLLEPALGTPRFLVLYFASLLAGSFGALLLDPNALTLGASGAIFGLAGATFVIARGRGMDAIAGQIGFLIVINLIFSFTAATSASAHTSAAWSVASSARWRSSPASAACSERGGGRPSLAMVAVAVASVLGALALA